MARAHRISDNKKQVEGVLADKTSMNLAADEDWKTAMSNDEGDHKAQVLVTRKLLLPSVSQLQTIIGAGGSAASMEQSHGLRASFVSDNLCIVDFTSLGTSRCFSYPCRELLGP